MSTIVTRDSKGSPLTNAELDANFNNLNTDKLEKSGGTMTGNLVVPTANSAPPLHHNDIINGDFRIVQAGTSFAAAVAGAYDLDGWRNLNSSAAVFTVAQVAGSTSGRLARQVTITTADAAVAVGDYVCDEVLMEGYNIEKYVGATFTIAFRAKVPVAGIHCVALRNSLDDRSYIKEINFPTANVWQDCSFTVTGGLPTAGTWNYTNGKGLQVAFTHMCGTTFQTTPDAWNTGNFLGTAAQVNDCATVGNVWALEKVTMNLGTVAAVSEISVEQELARCQRYYETGFIRVDAYHLAAQRFGATLGYKVTKRVTPTVAGVGITYSNASGFAVDGASDTAGFQGYAVATATGGCAFTGTWTSAARL